MPDRNPDPGKETLTRARRIETRLTTLMIALGVDPVGQKPEFDPGMQDNLTDAKRCASVTLPSRDCSLKTILAAIPASWAGDVQVWIGSDHVTTLAVWDRT